MGITTRKGHIIGKPGRLSETALWRLMGDSYDTNGVSSWSSGKVPYLLTTGPLIAKAYRRLVKAYLDDQEREGVLPDRSETVYIVELGAGTGRLAWNFLSYCKRFPLRQKIVYVLTDVIEENVKFWSKHKYLNSLAQEGLLDYAYYDVLSDRPIELLYSKQRITSSNPCKTPMIFLANYLFDVLPQDLFGVSASEDFEELIVPVTDDPAVNWDAPGLFSHLFFATDKKSIDTASYYENDFLNSLLGKAAEHYRSCLTEEDDFVRFLFPKAPLLALDNLRKLTNGKMLLMTAERPGSIRQDSDGERSGETAAESFPVNQDVRVSPPQADSADGTREAVRPAHLLAMGVHGTTFSLPVDMDILSLAAAHYGGKLLRADPVPVGLEVCALLLTKGESGLLEEEVGMSLGEQSPEELFLTLRKLRRHKEELSLADLVIAVRTSGYDAHFLFQVYDRLQEILSGEYGDKTDELARVLLEVDARHFPMDLFLEGTGGEAGKTEDPGIADSVRNDPENATTSDSVSADKENVLTGGELNRNVDLSSLLATLLASVGEIDSALELLERHRERRGPQPAETFNTAVCLFLQGKVGSAEKKLQEVLAMDPTHAKAQQLRKQLRDLS